MPFLKPGETHPSENLPGFTMRLTLGSGLEVLLRRVDIQAVTLDSAQHVLSARSLLNVGSAHAKEAGDEAASLRDVPPREATMSPDEEIQTIQTVSKRLLRAALVAPRLEELIAAYGGREDMSEPDLGLGNDYQLLMTAVNDFSGDDAAAKEAKDGEAERFPGAVGGHARHAGKAVRPKAK